MYDTCAKYNISVLLDVHTAKDSQNGFDNSGQTNKLEWKTDTNFSHWPNAQANWQGLWNISAGHYEHIGFENFQWSLKNSKDLLTRWGNHSAFAAFEPVNEPWWNTDLVILKDFYREARKLTQTYAPQAWFVFHNSFQYWDTWNDLFPDNDHELVAMDHHYYQAWINNMNTTGAFCDDYEGNGKTADSIKYDVWWGEWSLATDVCAHWLGGFNDGNTDP
jgi:glucan 1,3-beta-glucosidase